MRRNPLRNTRGITILQAAITCCMLGTFLWAIQSIVNQGINRSLASTRTIRASSDSDQLYGLLMSVGRLARTCKKQINPLDLTHLLECGVDFKGQGIADLNQIPLARFRHDLAAKNLFYEKKEALVWTQNLLFANVTQFRFCDENDILNNVCTVDPQIMNQRMKEKLAFPLKNNFFRFLFQISNGGTSQGDPHRGAFFLRGSIVNPNLAVIWGELDL